MKKYNPQKIGKKWQGIWERIGIYRASDKIKGKKNFYSLVMFPYPSGDLHMGHWYNFVGADVYTRLKKMQGFNVMFPIGFDAFGLPAENAAIKHKIHPRTWTYGNIKRMRKQLKSIGASFDWDREVITCEPDYYKWTQWMFLQFYKKGLAYRAKVPCNFCPSCKTVLANEQVVDGKCERCDSEVTQKEFEQWFFKITACAEDLLKDLENLDWPDTTKIMQKNWIGKSEGWEIKFPITTNNKKEATSVNVFTTRADTLFGATYLVLAPEHPIIEKLKSKIRNYKYVRTYLEESRKKTERERISEIKEKTGIELKGIKAVNPVNQKEMPIFVADYVLIHYGTGAIMAVPAHDQRDFDFARKYNLPVIEVIKPYLEEKEIPKETPIVISDGRFEKAYEGEGALFNSGRFDGLPSKIAKDGIGEWLVKKDLAKKAVYYKLRDWLISRQRYWGAPIPMVFCQKCGWQPVKEKDLPVLLPNIRDFRPTGEGKSPLAKSKKFVQTTCPKCGKEAERETDTMDTFVCSSWYHLRYADPKNNEIFASGKKLDSWLPINMYIGGAEHAVMHLLYFRFFTKTLKDLGYLNFKEPAISLRHQGIILGPGGQKMSKSKGNVVNPEEQLEKYGTDVVRLYLCFMGPYNQGGPWNPRGIEGAARFLDKFRDYLISVHKIQKRKNFTSKIDKKTEVLLNKTIKKVGEDIENLKFNTAISSMMELLNFLRGPELDEEKLEGRKVYRVLDKKNLEKLLLILSPLAPHLTEDLWQEIKEIHPHFSEFKKRDSIHSQKWPSFDPRLIKEEKMQFIIQINGKVRDKIEVESGVPEKKIKELAVSREKIKKWIGDKEIKKTIFVPGKLINIVI